MCATVVTASTILVLNEGKRVKTARPFHYCEVRIEKTSKSRKTHLSNLDMHTVIYKYGCIIYRKKYVKSCGKWVGETFSLGEVSEGKFRCFSR